MSLSTVWCVFHQYSMPQSSENYLSYLSKWKFPLGCQYISVVVIYSMSSGFSNSNCDKDWIMFTIYLLQKHSHILTFLILMSWLHRHVTVKIFWRTKQFPNRIGKRCALALKYLSISDSSTLTIQEITYSN